VASTDSCYVVFLGSAVQTVTAPDASIVSGQLANANLEMPNTLDMNGKELILDADGDTSIEASADDTIVIDTGGSERARIDGSGNVFVSATATSGFQSSSSESGTIIYGAGGIASNSASDDVAAVFNRIGTDGNILTCKKDGASVFNIGFGGGATFIDGLSGDTGIKFEGAHLRPRDNGSDVDDLIDLGSSVFRFDDIRATNGSIVTSDKNEKNTITDSDLGLDFVNRLSPKSYKFNNKTRIHYGLIAQDVETVLGDVKKDASQFAGFCKDDISEKQDGSKYRYGLRYHEFISPMIQAIKDLKEEVDTLKAKVTALESK